MFIGEIQRREDSFIFEVASKELRNWISTPRTPLCRLKMKTFLSVKGDWRAAASGRVSSMVLYLLALHTAKDSPEVWFYWC